MLPALIEKSVVLEQAACQLLETLLCPDDHRAETPTVPNILSPITLLGAVSGPVGLFSRSAANGLILLHEAQTVTQTGPLVFDEAYQMRVEVDPTSEIGRAARFDTVLRNRQDIAVLRMETRLRWMAREQVAGLTGPSFQHYARNLQLDPRDVVAWRPTRGVVDAYLRLSGDENPAHADTATAQALGLPAAVVPGMLLLARIDAQLRRTFDRAPGMLRARFVGFVEIGAEVRIVMQRPVESAEAGDTRLRVVLAGPDETICAIVDATLG